MQNLSVVCCVLEGYKGEQETQADLKSNWQKNKKKNTAKSELHCLMVTLKGKQTPQKTDKGNVQLKEKKFLHQTGRVLLSLAR